MPASPEQSDIVTDGSGDQDSVEERGSFTHAVCPVCGWSGPGRRSRGRAHKDVASHRDGGCLA